ncbi:MAG: type II toxin-antitoxin system VapC family toxin [Acidiferrobacterales bacterium]
MILYLDTSALVKLYVSEVHEDIVLSAFREAQIRATHMLAYVEARSAFARLHRAGKLTIPEWKGVRQEFLRDWSSYLQIMADEPNIERAADLVEDFGLRAYDAVHLAAADYLRANAATEITFACFDRHLNRAAKTLGLYVLADG